MAYEQTLVLAKPDAVARNIEMQIFRCYAGTGLKLSSMRDIWMTQEMVRQFYREHVDKPFFPGLVTLMTSGKCTAATFRGQDAVKKVRDLNGATDPWKALPGTIRHDFRDETSGGPRNLVHGSDSVEAAKREAAILFPVTD